MRTKLLSIAAASLFILFSAGCKKDPTGPQIGLSLKEVNGTSFKPGDRIKFTFEFTPKTTDSDTLFISRKFYTCPFITTDTSKFTFPEWDNNTKGELIYEFQYGTGGFFNGCINNITGLTRTDSLHYAFWVKDKDGNVSDTVRSPKIILNRN